MIEARLRFNQQAQALGHKLQAAAGHRSQELGGPMQGRMERPLRMLQGSCQLTSPQELALQTAQCFSGPRGVTVSTLDSESSDRGSNSRETSFAQVSLLAVAKRILRVAKSVVRRFRATRAGKQTSGSTS